MVNNIENQRKAITVGKIDILDTSEYFPERKFYGLTADVFNGEGEKVGRQVLLKEIVSSEQEVLEFIKRSTDQISNIHDLQSINGGHLENVQIFNLSVDQAEQEGFLQKPGVIQHIAVLDRPHRLTR